MLNLSETNTPSISPLILNVHAAIVTYCNARNVSASFISPPFLSKSYFATLSRALKPCSISLESGAVLEGPGAVLEGAIDIVFECPEVRQSHNDLVCEIIRLKEEHKEELSHQHAMERPNTNSNTTASSCTKERDPVTGALIDKHVQQTIPYTKDLCNTRDLCEPDKEEDEFLCTSFPLHPPTQYLLPPPQPLPCSFPSPSPLLPGSLLITPQIRACLQRRGRNSTITEHATWLLTIAVREYIKATLTKATKGEVEREGERGAEREASFVTTGSIMAAVANEPLLCGGGRLAGTLDIDGMARSAWEGALAMGERRGAARGDAGEVEEEMVEEEVKEEVVEEECTLRRSGWGEGMMIMDTGSGV